MQILVVVANIQVGTLKAEVEKGFMVTAVDHELVDPKPQVNPANNVIVSAYGTFQGYIRTAKGSQVNIPELGHALIRQRK